MANKHKSTLPLPSAPEPLRRGLFGLDDRIAGFSEDESAPLAPPSRDAEVNRRVKTPSVVLRTDGRFGVAWPKRGPVLRCELGGADWRHLSAPWFQAVLGRTSFNTSMTSGFFHEKVTYETRKEAEERAWAAARELGNITDWP